MIARLIAARGTLGHSRQIFFASVGGYDLHGTQVAPHHDLLRERVVEGCRQQLPQPVREHVGARGAVELKGHAAHLTAHHRRCGDTSG